MRKLTAILFVVSVVIVAFWIGYPVGRLRAVTPSVSSLGRTIQGDGTEAFVIAITNHSNTKMFFSAMLTTYQTPPNGPVGYAFSDNLKSCELNGGGATNFSFDLQTHKAPRMVLVDYYPIPDRITLSAWGFLEQWRIYWLRPKMQRAIVKIQE